MIKTHGLTHVTLFVEHPDVFETRRITWMDAGSYRVGSSQKLDSFLESGHLMKQLMFYKKECFHASEARMLEDSALEVDGEISSDAD